MKKFKQYIKQSIDDRKKLDLLLGNRAKGFYGFNMKNDKIYWFENEKIYNDLTKRISWNINPLESELEFIIGEDTHIETAQHLINEIIKTIEELHSENLVIGRSGHNMYLRLKKAKEQGDNDFIASVVKYYGITL